MACSLGGGAAVKIKDASVICDEGVVNTICELAEKKGIKFQREILLFGGTDTSAMQLAGSGAAVGAISIPTRYIHSAAEMIDKTDLENTVKLIKAVMETDIEGYLL
jgi:endoglucanase